MPWQVQFRHVILHAFCEIFTLGCCEQTVHRLLCHEGTQLQEQFSLCTKTEDNKAKQSQQHEQKQKQVL